MTEQLLVEPTLDLPLSQDGLLHIPCDKDDLYLIMNIRALNHTLLLNLQM